MVRLRPTKPWRYNIAVEIGAPIGKGEGGNSSTPITSCSRELSEASDWPEVARKQMAMTLTRQQAAMRAIGQVGKILHKFKKSAPASKPISERKDTALPISLSGQI